MSTKSSYPIVAAEDFNAAFVRSSIHLNNSRKDFDLSLAGASRYPTDDNIRNTIKLADVVKEATEDFLKIRATILELRAQAVA